MNSLEFNALAKDGDFTRVVISRYRDSYMMVSAILICDNESHGLTAYNYLRDSEGQIVKFEHIGEAEKVIRQFGYKGQLTILGPGEKMPRPAAAIENKNRPGYRLNRVEP